MSLREISTEKLLGGSTANDSIENGSATSFKHHIEHRKSVDLETHGDEAITLLQNSSSTYGKCFDMSRLMWGSALLILSIFSVIYAITEHETLFPKSFPNWTLYVILVFILFGLGVLEGLQIAVVELAHEDPNHFKRYYPRTTKMLKWENTGRNVERFLIGRQVLVVLLVFVCARITTFDVWIIDVPGWVINTFMFSGFLGVILVVTIAQLTPQVLAAAYPVEFLNLYGMNVAFGVCLFVESTGIAHAVWFLCYAVKRSVYSCVCKHHAVNKKRMMDRAHKNNKNYTKDMVDIVKDIEMNVDEESKSKVKPKKKTSDEIDIDNDKDFTINNAKIIFHVEQLMQQVDDRPDLFYLHGDDKYVAPSYYSDKFKESGLNIPCFLLPPSDKNHIPPHIVAMALLRKAAADSKK